MNRSNKTTRTLRKPTSLVAATLLAFGVVLAGASTASAAPVTNVFTVDSRTAGDNGAYFNTGIVLPAGTNITMSATGTASVNDAVPGLARNANGINPSSCIAACPLPGASVGALIAKIGTAPPVVAGTGPITLTGTGPVLLAYNDAAGSYTSTISPNSGAFQVTANFDSGVGAPKCLNLGSACIPLP